MSLVPAGPASDAVETAKSEDACRPEHCFAAFDALYVALTHDAESVPLEFPDEKYPLFVTWNTLSSRPGRAPRLRGCIGTFEAQPIHEGIPEYALISAFRDHRFRKIQKSELETLECAISFLTDFEDAESYLDWTVGVHGIYITFSHPSLLPTSTPAAPSPLATPADSPRPTVKQKFTATYLPHVAEEQGWDRLDTVDSAIRKAGWSGPITEDLRRSIHLRRYQSRKCSVNWDDFVEWREQLGYPID